MYYSDVFRDVSLSVFCSGQMEEWLYDTTEADSFPLPPSFQFFIKADSWGRTGGCEVGPKKLLYDI